MILVGSLTARGWAWRQVRQYGPPGVAPLHDLARLQSSYAETPLVHPGPADGSFNYLLYPKETELEAAKRQVWETEESIDYLLTELLRTRSSMLTLDTPDTGEDLTNRLLLIESYRTLLVVQQAYVTSLEKVG